MKALIAKYLRVLTGGGIQARQFRSGKLNPKPLDQLQHVVWMLRLMDESLPEDIPLDRWNRWIGFVQGVLWACAIFTIDEL